MMGLTARQQEALRFIYLFQAQSGKSPSYREIADGLGLAGETSKSVVHRLLGNLQERGAIRRQCGAARSIEIIAPVAVSRAPDGARLYFVPVGGQD